MKKVWIYALAIFMLVSAFSFAGAAEEVVIEKPLSGDAIEIPLGSAIAVNDGDLVSLDLIVANLSAKGPVGFAMEILSADNTPVEFKVNKFNATIVDSNDMSITDFKVGGFAAVPGQEYNIPAKKAISLSGKTSYPASEIQNGYVRIVFNGTANETKTIPADAKVKLTLTGIEYVTEDVTIFAGINVNNASEAVFGKAVTLVKAKPFDPTLPTYNAEFDPATGNTTIVRTAEMISAEATTGTVLTIPGADVNLTITFDGAANVSDTIVGKIMGFKVDYDNISALAGGDVSNELTIIPSIILDNLSGALPIIDPEIKSDVINIIKNNVDAKKAPSVLAMVSADGSRVDAGVNFVGVDIVILIPKSGIDLTKDTVEVYHIKDGRLSSPLPLDFKVVGDYYQIAFDGESFSSYAVAKVTQATPVDPVTPSSGGSSGSSTWATTTPTPTVTPTPTTTPTGTPTEGAPTDVPTSGQPTKPAGTPAPILGILAGLAIAGIVLRRK